MNSKKPINKLIIVGLLLALAAPFALANLDRIMPGINTVVQDNNQFFSATIIGAGDTNATLCSDTDNGFNPTQDGNMFVTFTDRNMSTGIFSDHCLDSNTLIEFACGAHISGAFISDLNAYAFKFNCGSLNKVCNAGKCV